MNILGITSKINDDLFLFFYDYDNVTEYQVLEDINFISQVFDIDIYLLKSSNNSFHAISFDILTKERVSSIQNWSCIYGDYLNLNDIESCFFNILRIGEKHNKKTPQFIKVIYALNNKHLKSNKHYQVYRKLCNIPRIPKRLKETLINCTKENLIIYKSRKK